MNDNPDLTINNVDSINFLQFSYLRHGHYSLNLENWFKHFKKTQFMHFATEDLDQNYDKIMNSLFLFFNLSEINLKKETRKNIGVGKGVYPPMNKKTRDFLIDYYKPHNEKLYNLIGKKFDWDK